MQRALVTGGGGFVGLAIVKRLVALGIETAVVGRNRYPELEQLGVRHFQGDIRDRQFLVNAVRGCDTVFHVAAKAGIWGPWREYYTINVEGTKNVLAACLQNRVGALVYTSTPSVVFQGHIAGADESIGYASRFLCHYARSKALAEQEVLAANGENLKVTALRPHLVWGPGDTNLLPRLIARGKRRLLKRVGQGDNRVDISYIDNVADAHLKAAHNLKTSATAAGRAYFISQGEPVVLWSWINDLFQRLDIPLVEKSISFQQAYIAGFIMEGIYKALGIRQEPLMTRFLAEQLAKSHWFSIQRAVNDFGYQPAVSTAEGLDRTVAWLKKDGTR